MITTNIYDLKGKITGKINLPQDYFGAKVNQALLAQAIYVYLSNQRRAQAKTKTRGEVSLTKAKWFRQKGTGRARHGARSAPIFVGGGVAHGPRGNQNWAKTLSKRLRGQALVSALSSKWQNKEVLIVSGWEKLSGKTKELNSAFGAFLDKKTKKTQKFLLVLPKKSELVRRAGRNIPGLSISEARLLNAYQVLNSGRILITPEAVESLKKLNEKRPNS